MAARELFEVGQKFRNNGRIGEAVLEYHQARALALRTGDLELAAHNLHMTGVALYQDGRFEAAEDYLLMAREEFGKLSLAWLEAAVLRDLGAVARGQGDYAKAKGYLADSIGMLETSGNFGHLGISKVGLGKVFAKEKNFAEAERLIREGIEDIGKGDDRFFEALALVDLVEVLLEEEKIQEVLSLLDRSVGILDKLGDEGTNTSLKERIKMLKGKVDKV